MGKKPIKKTMNTIKTVLSNFTSSSLKTVPTGCTNHFNNPTASRKNRSEKFFALSYKVYKCVQNLMLYPKIMVKKNIIHRATFKRLKKDKKVEKISKTE